MNYERDSAESLCTLFQRRVRDDAARIAIRSADDSVVLTWAQYGARVREVASGLAAVGVSHGSTVGIMLTNRVEFHIIDAAVMHLGAIGFSVYNTSSVEQVSYVVGNSKPTVLVTESQFVDKVRHAAPHAGSPVMVCVDAGDPDTMTLDDLTARGESGDDFDFDSAWRSVGADDVLTLIYTSGTTGDPKGVELTHGNLLYQLEVVQETIGDLTHGRVLSYLPDAHLINRWLCQYAPMRFGMTVVDVDDPKKLIDVLPRVRPTAFAAVPMLWYKIKGRIETTIDSAPGLKGSLGRWAVSAGRRRAAAEIAGRRPGAGVRVAAQIADVLVLSRIRSTLGLDRVEVAVSGAAAIDPAALEFMLALGVPVLEAWGMSETSAVTTINPVDAPRFGTVGVPIPGTEVVLSQDGEILVRGGGVMRGYHRDPDRTVETLDADGWIHTGDIGSFDERGYLRIVDRKKELIINSGGKNMSPSAIEGAIKAASPLVGSVVAIGDDRPYVTALITLDSDTAQQLADRLGIPECTAEAMSRHPEVEAEIMRAVDAANKRLSRVESVRRWRVLPEFWQPGGDELTPTLKLRRVPIGKKYADVIDELYPN